MDNADADWFERQFDRALDRIFNMDNADADWFERQVFRKIS